ncbi:MAG TPA: peptide-methionine (R)-S-oxide reductase MsrB [Candidatus Saccharimonadia bacterium]|nr:peptide-methionine (R)-S-oxide reductase MsrB [Candidatus Saccharimonadia bacterium]
MHISEDELKKKLTPEQYRALREGGTETPFSGKYVYNKEDGIYVCLVCGASLFSSSDKHDTNTPGLIGWPSFSDVLDSKNIELFDDDNHGMHRIEVKCKNCGSHLGHLFEDASMPGGKHYCINSVGLDFKPKK